VQEFAHQGGQGSDVQCVTQVFVPVSPATRQRSA
jgi:hypothetical protein